MHQLAAMALLLVAQALSAPSDSSMASLLARAEARYRQAIATSPRIAAYHESLALVLERENRVADALASHRQAVALDSSSARNRQGYGELLLHMGRTKEAIPQLLAAARLDPTSAEIRQRLAEAWVIERRPGEAAAALADAHSLAPGDSGIARALAALTPARSPLRYHDYSELANDAPVQWSLRAALRALFAVVLCIAGAALIAPIAGTLLLIVRLPIDRLRRRFV